MRVSCPCHDSTEAWLTVDRNDVSLRVIKVSDNLRIVIGGITTWKKTCALLVIICFQGNRSRRNAKNAWLFYSKKEEESKNEFFQYFIRISLYWISSRMTFLFNIIVGIFIIFVFYILCFKFLFLVNIMLINRSFFVISSWLFYICDFSTVPEFYDQLSENTLNNHYYVGILHSCADKVCDFEAPQIYRWLADVLYNDTILKVWMWKRGRERTNDNEGHEKNRINVDLIVA